MAGVTYDTGALLAAERNDRRMWALHAGFLSEEIVPVAIRSGSSCDYVKSDIH